MRRSLLTILIVAAIAGWISAGERAVGRRGVVHIRFILGFRPGVGVVGARLVLDAHDVNLTNSPPIDFTWSATSARVSFARTIAPRPTAVPIAARPATPAPAMNTFAGGI